MGRHVIRLNGYADTRMIIYYQNLLLPIIYYFSTLKIIFYTCIIRVLKNKTTEQVKFHPILLLNKYNMYLGFRLIEFNIDTVQVQINTQYESDKAIK